MYSTSLDVMIQNDDDFTCRLPTKRNMKYKAPIQASNRRYDGDASSDILGYSSSFTVLPLIFMSD
jgi:hypothetical protein